MAFLFDRTDDGFDRLQALMLNLRAGDVVSVDEAVRISGLSEQFCSAALEALAHVGLLVRESDSRFVRQALVSARSMSTHQVG